MYNKINTHNIDYKFPKLEEFIIEFEEFARKLFKNDNLKLAFRIHNGYKQISLENYLLSHNNDFGEFSIYLIENVNHKTITKSLEFSKENNIFLGGFCLNQMHGCCGIAILYHSFVNFDYRNKKIGHFFVKLQKILAREKHFSILVCTDVVTNSPQVKILNKFGFKRRFIFQNAKTRNYVELRSVDLFDEQYYDVWRKKYSIFQKLKNLKTLLKMKYLLLMIN